MFATVIHSGKPTGAPKIGLEVALWIKEKHSSAVTLISQDAGPIVGTAQEVGVSTFIASGPKISSYLFSERVAACQRIVERLAPSAIYVNSAASSAWALAGKKCGAKVALHIHELDQDLGYLLGAGATCIDVCMSADLVLVAGSSVVKAIRSRLGYVPGDIINIGVFTDPHEVSEKALRHTEPKWLFNNPFRKTVRKVIGMCGTACFRKGIDIFITLAHRLPEYDFVWIGEWTDDADRAVARAGLHAPFTKNFYCSGQMANPYSLLSILDLFVLSSREDPNPIAVLEAMALGKPIVCFTGAGDSWRIGGPGLFALYGEADVEALCPVVSSLMSDGSSISTTFPEGYSRSRVMARLAEELSRRGFLDG